MTQNAVADPLELARTIEARLSEEDPDLARTWVSRVRETIDPKRHASARGMAALASIREIGASIEGRIALHETLGEGGMGVVHLATQATVGRHVAVKTLRAGADPAVATLRILREAWVTGTLEHPNVVPVYDVGVDAAGTPVIVMKRIEGSAWCDLMHAQDVIAKRFGVTDPLEWNLRILTSVCNAVHFAHSRGILHRDLKPDNVMVGSFGEVYVLDWGIAVSLREDPTGRLPAAADATDIAGTLCYIAPEMLLGDPKLLSPRTDVYLLGAILYEIFAGAPPHGGDSLHAIMAASILSEPKFDKSFPAEARVICARAMSRDPAGRYETADELRLALESYLRHRGSRRIAWEAKQSLDRLLHTIAHEPAGEERALAIFNLLGECRFGYRSALSAWAGNEAARKGLDRALVAVVDNELREGDAHAAASLLREVSAPPGDIAARVEAAVRARAEHDDRLKRLETDFDPTVGSRTRTFLGSIFSCLWTVVPLVGWFASRRGYPTQTYVGTIAWSLGFLLLGFVVFAWARETLTKTQLNRRVSQTLALHLVAQVVLAVGAWMAGIPEERGLILMMFAWCLTQTLLGVWVERWFFAAAAASAASFIVASARPGWVFPIMSADNFVLTLVLVLVWFPRQDVAKIRERRQELRTRALLWLRDGGRAKAHGSHEEE